MDSELADIKNLGVSLHELRTMFDDLAKLVEGQVSKLKSQKWRLFLLQGVHWTLERLWNLARETFAPVWSLSKVFMLRNLVTKSLQKIWFENNQKRRPRGSSIKHGETWPAKFDQMCLPQIFQVYHLHLSQL